MVRAMRVRVSPTAPDVLGYRQVRLRHRILNPTFVGSNPTTPAKSSREWTFFGTSIFFMKRNGDRDAKNPAAQNRVSRKPLQWFDTDQSILPFSLKSFFVLYTRIINVGTPKAIGAGALVPTLYFFPFSRPLPLPPPPLFSRSHMTAHKRPQDFGRRPPLQPYPF